MNILLLLVSFTAIAQLTVQPVEVVVTTYHSDWQYKTRESVKFAVSAFFSGYPALCDLTGYLHGRAGGWPPSIYEKAGGMYHNANKETLETLPYYDVVNFARELKVQGLYSWGFNDVIVPPTSMMVAYNVITAPKEILLFPESGHWQYPELAEKRDAWTLKKLAGGK